MSYAFSKDEKLKGEKQIEKLFLDGRSIGAFPLRLYYAPLDVKGGASLKIGFSVGKKNFRKAVDRNRIKRLLRESYRQNKPELINNSKGHYALMVLYLGKDMPNIGTINAKLKTLFDKFLIDIAEE
jgi:ribonuclease P protein component